MKNVYLVFTVIIFLVNIALYSQEIQFTSPTMNQKISGGSSSTLIPLTLTYASTKDNTYPSSIRIEYIKLYSHVGEYYDDIGNGIPDGTTEMPEQWNLAPQPGTYHWILQQYERYWIDNKYEILPTDDVEIYFYVKHTIKVKNDVGGVVGDDVKVDFHTEESGFEAKKSINENLSVQAIDQYYNGNYYVWKYTGADPSEWTIQKQGLSEVPLSSNSFKAYYPQTNDNNAILKSYLKLQNPPTAPQNVQLSTTSSQNARISWSANSEPEISGYEVERKESGSWEVIAAVSATTTSYTDDDVNINSMFEDEISWRVSAKNTYDQYSPYSSIVSTENGVLHKRIGIQESEELNHFSLMNAYPNPFNPSTNISYQIPKGGQVNLEIYNSLGQVVKTLVNKFQPNGFYTVKFDASDLPSGIYIYKLTSSEFSNTKKLLLTK